MDNANKPIEVGKDRAIENADNLFASKKANESIPSNKNILKYFVYEFKKHLLPIVVFTVIACLIYLTAILNSDFIYTPYSPPDVIAEYPTATRAINCLAFIPAIVLCILCTVVPVMMFSFKTNRRCADCFYSLPLKREKLYLVKSLVGLLTVFIPYIICYWLGFAFTAFSENMFKLSAFVPLFFVSVPLGIALFGINSFAFTRANKTMDGIIFMAMFACALPVLIIFIERLSLSYVRNSVSWFTYSPIIFLFDNYSNLILNQTVSQNFPMLAFYILAAATGVAAWIGLWFLPKKEKAENAEQVSSSLFGYKVLIPYFMLFTLSSFGLSIGIFMFILIVLVGLISYMIYRRSFKLTAADWITFASTVVLGFIISTIIELIQRPDVIYNVLLF